MAFYIQKGIEIDRQKKPRENDREREVEREINLPSELKYLIDFANSPDQSEQVLYNFRGDPANILFTAFGFFIDKIQVNRLSFCSGSMLVLSKTSPNVKAQKIAVRRFKIVHKLGRQLEK